jgi:hypothetical protein
VNSQLNHKVHFEVGGGGGPIGVLFVDLSASSAATNNIREPIFIAEEVVGEYGGEGIEHRIQTEFEDVVEFVDPLLALVLGMQKRFDGALHEMIVRILDDLHV